MSESGTPKASLRECQTPSTFYQHGVVRKHILQVRLVFPFRMEDWVEGSSAITPYEDDNGPARLQAYEQMYAERRRITDMIHDAMEPVGADCYRVMRELDARLGTEDVERGIIKPYRGLPFEE